MDSFSSTTVLLSIAVIQIVDAGGDYRNVRAILDSGNQTNFITEACGARLGCIICPLHNPLISLKVDVVIFPKICDHMHSAAVEISNFCSLSNLIAC